MDGSSHFAISAGLASLHIRQPHLYLSCAGTKGNAVEGNMANPAHVLHIHHVWFRQVPLGSGPVRV